MTDVASVEHTTPVTAALLHGSQPGSVGCHPRAFSPAHQRPPVWLYRWLNAASSSAGGSATAASNATATKCAAAVQMKGKRCGDRPAPNCRDRHACLPLDAGTMERVPALVICRRHMEFRQQIKKSLFIKNPPRPRLLSSCVGE